MNIINSKKSGFTSEQLVGIILAIAIGLLVIVLAVRLT